MLHEKLSSVHESLGQILPHVDPTRAEVIRQCRRNLASAAEQAESMENGLLVDALHTSAGASCLMDRPPFPHEMVVRHG